MLDDLWLNEQFTALNCLNETNGSSLLITSRMRDAAPDADTVDVTVLGAEEAALLLMRTACLGELPAAARPPAVDEIVRSCAFLPLVSIQAQMTHENLSLI